MDRARDSLDENGASTSGREALLAGSCFRGSYEQWRRARDGFVPWVVGARDVLDLGCANGLLLHSLIEWSGTRFAPHGVDIVSERVEAARSLFPEHRTNFWCADLRKLAWTRRGYDVVLAPWVGDDAFLDGVGAYLDDHAGSTLLFSLYDGEMGLFDAMHVECRRRWGDVGPVVARGEILRIVPVRRAGRS